MAEAAAMDERIRRLAARSPNFGFLLDHEPLLVLDGATAESYIYTDPNAALFRARRFGEVLARKLVSITGTPVKGDRQIDRLVALTQAGVIVAEIRHAFDEIRKIGNEAVHGHFGEVRVALTAVRTCFELGVGMGCASSSRSCHGRDWMRPTTCRCRAARPTPTGSGAWITIVSVNSNTYSLP